MVAIFAKTNIYSFPLKIRKLNTIVMKVVFIIY